MIRSLKSSCSELSKVIAFISLVYSRKLLSSDYVKNECADPENKRQLDLKSEASVAVHNKYYMFT